MQLPVCFYNRLFLNLIANIVLKVLFHNKKSFYKSKPPLPNVCSDISDDLTHKIEGMTQKSYEVAMVP